MKKEKALYKIGDEIDVFLRRYGRVSVMQTKEKHNTLRVYCSFGWWGLHSITHPGYAGLRLPVWLRRLDSNYLWRFMPMLNKVVVPYQEWLYKKAYARAVKQNPNLAYEILVCADRPDLLKHLYKFIQRPEDHYDDVF